MIATRWISRTLLMLALGSIPISLAARASVETGGDAIAGVDGRVVVEPEQLAAWKLERLGARLRYDEGKFGRPVVEVDLSGCPVTETVLEELLVLPSLRYLNLKGANLGDRELKRLANLKRLRKVVLENTAATLLIADELRGAIPGLTVDFGPDARQIGYLPPPAVLL